MSNFSLQSPRLDTPENYQQMRDCNINLNEYSRFAESFFHLVDYFKDNPDGEDGQIFTDLADELQNYLDGYSDPLIVLIKDQILGNCFWFEKYFWWRHTEISTCYSNVLTKGVKLEEREALKVSKLYNLLRGRDYQSEDQGDDPDSKLSLWCNLDQWDSLVLHPLWVSTEDRYYVQPPPPFHCPTGPPPPVTGPSWFGSLAYINPSLILDPNNPLFKAISKVSCYFYPISDPFVPENTSMSTLHNNYKQPFIQTKEYLEILQNISYTLQVYKSKAHDLRKSEVAQFVTHPNVNDERIASDLDYFQGQINKYSDVMKKIYSKVELYKELFDLFSTFTEFIVANFTADNIADVDLFQFGEELARESGNIERCDEGTVNKNVKILSK